METFDPGLLGITIVTAGVGLAMVRLASHLKMIERRPDRRCPSCGHRVGTGRLCPCAR
jgi:hypothetical protein